MPTLTRALLWVALACAPALAQPKASRVVLADPDPELARALTTALAPWHLEVVVDENTPVDKAQAQARADEGAARFVVWRRQRDLVVFDRETGVAEHRDAPDGALDPVSAAAAALTVKTLMRLPPPEEEAAATTLPPSTDTPPPAGEPTESSRVPEIRVQAGFGTRVARGSTTDVSARLGGAALVRLFHSWHIGLAADLGTATSIERSGFKGEWSDWAVLGVASWTHPIGRWELEPHVAAGVERATLEGAEMGMARRDRDLVALVRGGLWVRWRYGLWTVGGTLDLERDIGTPTYTRANQNSTFFEAPSSSATLGIVIAADLGR